MIKQKIQQEIKNIKASIRNYELSDNEGMVRILNSRISMLVTVLRWIDEESGSNDGMRSIEEVKEKIKELDKQCSEYIELDCLVSASTAAEKAEILEWALNKQEGKE